MHLSQTIQSALVACTCTWRHCHVWDFAPSFGGIGGEDVICAARATAPCRDGQAVTAWMLATSSVVADAAASIGLHNEVTWRKALSHDVFVDVLELTDFVSFQHFCSETDLSIWLEKEQISNPFTCLNEPSCVKFQGFDLGQQYSPGGSPGCWMLIGVNAVNTEHLKFHYNFHYNFFLIHYYSVETFNQKSCKYSGTFRFQCLVCESEISECMWQPQGLSAVTSKEQEGQDLHRCDKSYNDYPWVHDSIRWWTEVKVFKVDSKATFDKSSLDCLIEEEMGRWKMMGDDQCHWSNVCDNLCQTCIPRGWFPADSCIFSLGFHILAEVLSFPRFGMSHVSHIAIGLPDSNYLASVFGVFSVPPFRTLSTWECQVNLT